MTKTVVRAEVTCLNCGRMLGELEGERGSSFKDAQFKVPAGGRGLQRTQAGLRCGYCGGKAIIEAVETVRQIVAA